MGTDIGERQRIFALDNVIPGYFKPCPYFFAHRAKLAI